VLIPLEQLPHRKIRGIIHIGAHEAEELDAYLKPGINEALWIEANPSLYPLLRQKLARFTQMRLGEFAAGEETGVGMLNVANNGQSSSLLELGTHQQDHPDISFTRTERVYIQPVDQWLESLGIDRSIYSFVNLDVQGYELSALKGMSSQLRHVDYVYTEVNRREVYRACAQKSDIDRYLAINGLHRAVTAMTAYGWGDALYARQRHKRLWPSFHLKNGFRPAKDSSLKPLKIIWRLLKDRIRPRSK
jgi:FkbM family methyltransferase